MEAPPRLSSPLPLAVGGLLVLLAGVTSTLDAAWFALFAAGTAGLGAADLATLATRKGIWTPRILCTVAAVAVVLIGYQFGESGLGIGLGVVLVAVMGSFVFMGLRPGVLTGMASATFSVLYVGFLGSFPVLLRGVKDGEMLLLVLLVVVAAYHAGRWMGIARLGGPVAFTSSTGPLTWSGVAGGVAAATLAGLAAGLAFGPPLAVGTGVLLGLLGGVGAALGDLAGLVLLTDLGVEMRESWVPGFGGLVARLTSILVAAPAFFYGFKLYLT